MGTRDYRELHVWQRAKALAVGIYRATAAPAFKREWGLRDQLRRSAVSVPSNIAEGNERGSDKDCLRFLYFARGSLAELSTQLEIAAEVGLLESEASNAAIVECRELSRMVMALIRHRSG